MNKLFGVTLAAMLIAGSASAADMYVGIDVGSGFNVVSNYDNASVMGAKFGVDFGWFRPEVAYTHYEGNRAGSAFGDLDSDVITFRGIFEQDYGRWTPYAGLGMGFGFFDGSATRDDNVFIGEALTGVKYKFNDQWSGDLGVTYARTFEGDIVRKSVTATDDFENYTIRVGAIYKF